jgi:pimeloyl-ACP methyl ester carboxylesterase
MNTKLARARRRPLGTGDARRKLLAGVPVTERRLQLAGVSTSVLEGGEGRPMLLLHGPGGYGAIWQQVIADLSATHRVIAPDLPGHGASSVEERDLDVDGVMAWLGELVEQTCTTPPVVVGQLVGGAIAARFAAAHDDQLDRLVLVVPSGLAPFEPTPAFGTALTGFLSDPSEASHDDLWEHCVFNLDALRRRPAVRWEPMKAYNLDLALVGRATEAIQALMGQFAFDPIPEAMLARITVPTSLVWGRHDSIVPLAAGERASARYGWPLHVIEDAGNEPAIEAPRAFVRAVLDDRAPVRGRSTP